MKAGIGSRLAVGTALLVASAGCGASVGTDMDKAGGGPVPVTLRLGSADSDQSSGVSLLKYFAAQVEELSAGRTRVQIVFNAVGNATDFEPEMIRAVRDGTFDLGWVGARAWDTQGVSSFDALQAPFLITAYPVLDHVVSGPIATQMLAGLDSAGFVGLGLYPDQLRHPLGFLRPLRSRLDLAGATIRVTTSNAIDAMIRALGAVPVHLNGPAFATAIDEGQVDGAETSVGGAASLPASSIMTTNITFYAKTITLFANAKRFSSLSDDTRAIIREAAQRTRHFALEQDPEGDELTTFCETGGTVVMADEADLKAMRAAAQSVYADLQKDERTKAFINQIQDMKGAVSVPVPTPLPEACSSPKP